MGAHTPAPGTLWDQTNYELAREVGRLTWQEYEDKLHDWGVPPAPPPPHLVERSIVQGPGDTLGTQGESMLILRAQAEKGRLFSFDPNPDYATSVTVGQATRCILVPFLAEAAVLSGERLNW